MLVSGFVLAATVAATFVPAPTTAAVISFTDDPFANTTINPDDGIRQFNNAGTVFLPTFDVPEDQFSFDLAALGITAPLRFINSLASGIPGNAGVNAVVLRDSDNDGNPVTPFNAGAAANLIAAQIETSAPGVFVYFNNVLNINRLAYSSDLSSTTADIAILAAIASPTGFGAVKALPTFSRLNFATIAEPVAAVPLPAAFPLLGGALLLLRSLGRRRKA